MSLIRRGELHPSCKVFLVFARKKQRSSVAVCLGNDPKLLAIYHLVAAEQAESLLQAQFVFSFVILAKSVAPITTQMAREKKEAAKRPLPVVEFGQILRPEKKLDATGRVFADPTYVSY